MITVNQFATCINSGAGIFDVDLCHVCSLYYFIYRVTYNVTSGLINLVR